MGMMMEDSGEGDNVILYWVGPCGKGRGRGEGLGCDIYTFIYIIQISQIYI